MSTLLFHIVIFVFLCFIIVQQGSRAEKDECTRNIRVTKRVSKVFYYRCGWRGFWRCQGKRYYKTYSTVKKCCEGYQKVNDKCVKIRVLPSTPRPTTTKRRRTTITTTTTPTTPNNSTTTTTTTTTTATTTTRPRHTCGVSTFDAKKLIVGGTPASQGQYPWLVSLVSTSHFCGGMIIDNRWILTAAHCVEFWWNSEYRYVYRVRVGEHDRYMTEDNEVTMAIEKVISHPEYSDVSVINDIALIKTSKSLVFNDYVKPICLPSANTRLQINSDVEIAGWGVTDPAETRATSRVLMKARMKLTSNSVCGSVYGWSLINNDVLCVTDGYGNRRKSACNGDSGGPLMLRKNGIMYGIGITSFGASSGCAAGDPVVYTDVRKYIDWINEQRANN